MFSLPLEDRQDFVLGLGRIGSVGLEIPLAIAVIGTAGWELLWLAYRNDSLRAVELHTNSGILLPRLSATACRAIDPASDTVMYRPVKNFGVV